jgi:hypothetical protein
MRHHELCATISTPFVDFQPFQPFNLRIVNVKELDINIVRYDLHVNRKPNYGKTVNPFKFAITTDCVAR